MKKLLITAASLAGILAGCNSEQAPVQNSKKPEVVYTQPIVPETPVEEVLRTNISTNAQAPFVAPEGLEYRATKPAAPVQKQVAPVVQPTVETQKPILNFQSDALDYTLYQAPEKKVESQPVLSSKPVAKKTAPVMKYESNGLEFIPKELQEEPEAVPAEPKSEGTSLDLILKGDYFAADNFRRASGNAKVIIGDKAGIMVYGQVANQTQKFDNGNLDGTIKRAGLTAFTYLGEPDSHVGYLEAGAIYEVRDFDIKGDNGGKLDFGNKTLNALVKLGYANGSNLDKDNFKDEGLLIDPARTKILGTLAIGKGDMTRDLEGDHKVTRATLGGQQQIVGPLYAVGGIAYQGEMIGDEANRIASGEIGPRLDLIKERFSVSPKLTIRKMEDNTLKGVEVEAYAVPIPGLRLQGVAGYEGDNGVTDGLGKYFFIGVGTKF